MVSWCHLVFVSILFTRVAEVSPGDSCGRSSHMRARCCRPLTTSDHKTMLDSRHSRRPEADKLDVGHCKIFGGGIPNVYQGMLYLLLGRMSTTVRSVLHCGASQRD